MNRKLRITFVLGGRGLSGGVRVVAIYGNKLIERGHEVTVVIQKLPTIRRPKFLMEQWGQRLGYALGLKRDHLSDFKGRMVIGGPEDISHVVPDGDAVIATLWSTADAVARLPQSKGQKFYFIQRYEADHFDPEKVDATWRLPLRKIVIAEHLRERAAAQFGDREVDMVFNGVDHEQFHAPPRERHDPPTVGLLYSTLPFKGVNIALDAVQRAKQQLPGLKVIAFGAEPVSEQLPLLSNSEFYHQPAQNEIRNIYARCDAWLCASYSEGFHLPPLEAMACRCPVVSTKVGGPNEVIQPGVNGYLVELEDVEGLADGLVKVLGDAGQWKKMSEAAYQRSVEFDWDHATDEFEAALLNQCRTAGAINDYTSKAGADPQ